TAISALTRVFNAPWSRDKCGVGPSTKGRDLAKSFSASTNLQGANMAGTQSAGYKLATYRSADGPRAGLVVEDKVFDAAKLAGNAAYASVIGILNDWKAAAGTLKAAAAKAAKSRVQSRPLQS